MEQDPEMKDGSKHEAKLIHEAWSKTQRCRMEQSTKQGAKMKHRAKHEARRRDEAWSKARSKAQR